MKNYDVSVAECKKNICKLYINLNLAYFTYCLLFNAICKMIIVLLNIWCLILSIYMHI